jgi:TolA-binding protein
MIKKRHVITARYNMHKLHAKGSKPYLVDGPGNEISGIPHFMWKSLSSVCLKLNAHACHTFFMSKKHIFFYLTYVLFSVSCATSSSNQKSKTTTQIKKSASVQAFEDRRKQVEDNRQSDKDLKRIEQKKQSMQNLNFRSYPQKASLKVQPSEGALKQLSYGQLYGELLAAHQRNDNAGFQVRFGAMMKNYSQTPLADDALYLAGLQQVGAKDYGSALKYFNQIIKEYPYSNKRVSALYAKGATYRKMNLDDQAGVIFGKVISQFPGSPESFRAANELRSIKK